MCLSCSFNLSKLEKAKQAYRLPILTKILLRFLFNCVSNLNFFFFFFCGFGNRWGPQLEQATYKNRQRLYLSEQATQISLLFLSVFILIKIIIFF